MRANYDGRRENGVKIARFFITAVVLEDCDSLISVQALVKCRSCSANGKGHRQFLLVLKAISWYNTSNHMKH